MMLLGHCNNELWLQRWDESPFERVLCAEDFEVDVVLTQAIVDVSTGRSLDDLVCLRRLGAGRDLLRRWCVRVSGHSESVCLPHLIRSCLENFSYSGWLR